MDLLVQIVMTTAMVLYFVTATVDHLNHRKLKGTDEAVTVAESSTHVVAVGVVLATWVVATFSAGLSVASISRWLLIAPMLLFVIGVADELGFHRIRCKNSLRENWYHAVMHFFMGVWMMMLYATWHQGIA